MKTILVVEDNDMIREDVVEILTLANYKVIAAANGKEGLEKILEYKPDLVLSDISMPVVDGLGMLHIMRKDPKTEGVPVIFLTARNDPSDFRNAMNSGADDFITKPFSGDDLLKAVENSFKKTDNREKNIRSGIISEQMAIAQVKMENETLESLFIGHDSMVYNKKQLIYKEGHMPHYLYYILKGKVKTFKSHPDGKQLVIGLFNTGDFLGHIALLEEAPYKESAQSLEDAELLLIPKLEFEQLVHKNLSVANKLIKILAKNISEHEEQLVGIAYNTLRKKVATALINLQKKYQATNKESFHIDISRDDLASIAGTATESLIRTLAEFKNEKLIDIGKDNKIILLNTTKLDHLLKS